MASQLLSNKASDARAAMGALIESRSLPLREDDPDYPQALANLAWRIADAMSHEHTGRSGGDK